MFTFDTLGSSVIERLHRRHFCEGCHRLPKLSNLTAPNSQRADGSNPIQLSRDRLCSPLTAHWLAVEHFPGELDSLRADNARLRRLLNLTEQQARAAEPDPDRSGDTRKHGLQPGRQGPVLSRFVPMPPRRSRDPLGKQARRPIWLDARHYWLGLTATPYRRDQLDDLIYHQLGSRTNHQCTRTRPPAYERRHTGPTSHPARAPHRVRLRRRRRPRSARRNRRDLPRTRRR